MGLKQDIVIVSRFGKRAGGTPGKYIDRYTSRDSATEPLVPYRAEDISEVNRIKKYISSYMVREKAADKVIQNISTKEELIDENDRVTEKSARLFGNYGLTYTKGEYNSAISRTEKAVSEDHVLITPVISFTHDYLQRMGIVPEDMPEPKHKGDYFGRVDQLKLRRAVTQGVNKICEDMDFIDPVWTGAIQVDTKHVHVHVTLIETSDNVPESRLVKKPVYEVVDGKKKQKRTKNNELVYENLGERGKLSKNTKLVFRREVEKDLTRTKGLKVLGYGVSSHKQMTEEKDISRSLTNSKIASLVSEIYSALPKKEVSEELETEESLTKAQKSWYYQNNDPKMQHANELSEKYVDLLFEEHGDAVGFNEFNDNIEAYTNKEVPDIGDQNNETQRNHLKDIAKDRLKETVINNFYEKLKPVRLVTNNKQRSELLLQEANDEISVSDKPFQNKLDLVEATSTPLGMRLTKCSDDQLKDLLADTFINTDEDNKGDLSSVLSLEKRIRDYPKRYESAKTEEVRYDRLLKDFDKLDEQNFVDKDAKVMRNLYDVNHDYYEGLSNKYRYLVYKGSTGGFIREGDQVYTKVKNDDYKSWIDENKAVLDQHAKKSEKLVDVKNLNSMSISESKQIDDMPDGLKIVLEEELNTKDLKLASNLDFYTRSIVLTSSKVVDKINKQKEYQNDITMEEFDKVKGYDMLDMIYDFDSDQNRSVKKEVAESYLDISVRRHDALADALDYLEASEQSDGLAYQAYQKQFDTVKEDVDLAQVVLEKGQLPRPVRRYFRQAEDEKVLENTVVLPANKSLDLADDFLPEVKMTTEEFSDEITHKHTNEVSEDNNLSAQEKMIQELQRINELYMRRQKELYEDKEEDDEVNPEQATIQQVEEKTIAKVNNVSYSEVKDVNKTNDDIYSDIDKEYLMNMMLKGDKQQVVAATNHEAAYDIGDF